jgi:hypothetical protein
METTTRDEKTKKKNIGKYHLTNCLNHGNPRHLETTTPRESQADEHWKIACQIVRIMETLGTWKLLLTVKAKMKNIGRSLDKSSKSGNLGALKLVPMMKTQKKNIDKQSKSWKPRSSETTAHDESQEEEHWKITWKLSKL